MAAPRNENEHERIYQAAIALFCEMGFNKTSYRDIAEACDTSKSMVQHYFPKKDLFAQLFFERHLEELSGKAQQLALNDNDPLEIFCLMGLMHFSFLIDDEKHRTFTSDVIESRALTDTVVSLEREWAKAHLGQNDALKAEDALTISLGGAYELLYQHRKHGTPLTARYVEQAAIVPFALMLGTPREQIEATLQRCEDAAGIA